LNKYPYLYKVKSNVPIVRFFILHFFITFLSFFTYQIIFNRMKKLVLTLAVASVAVANLFAQVCTPDPAYAALGVGVYPKQDTLDIGTTANGLHSPLPCGIVGQPYNFTFTVVVPSSIPFNGATIALNRVEVQGIDNLPTGVTWACAPSASPCKYLANTTGCMKFGGTVGGAAGIFDIKVRTKVYALASGALVLNQDFPPSTGNPISAATLPGRYVVTVLAAAGGTCPTDAYIGTRQVIQGSLAAQVAPNPAQNETFIKVSSDREQDATLTVTDAFGKVVVTKALSLDATSNNIISLDCSALAAGMYFYAIDNGIDHISERFLVQH
jgi:hypothetical protein